MLLAGWSRVQLPAGTRDFSLLKYVQTGYGADPASYPMAAGCCFPRGKAVCLLPYAFRACIEIQRTFTLCCVYCRCNVWCPTWLSVIANIHINWERRSTKLYTYRNSYDTVWAWVVLQHGITTHIIRAVETQPVQLVVAALCMFLQTLKKEIQLCK